jgi:hypothetical protein
LINTQEEFYTTESYRLNGKEIEAIELKAELLVNGVALDDSALKGVGTKYKEQIHWLFEWDFERHDTGKIPDDFELPDGTIVQFRKYSKSPFTIKADNDSLTLLNEGNFITEVKWIPRPEYYSKKTDDGTVMSQVAQIRGTDCLSVCYMNFCGFFKTDDQCRFCNIVPTKMEKKGDVISHKYVEQIGQTAEAAFKDVAKHVVLTGGWLPDGKEIKQCVETINVIKKYTGSNNVPGCAITSAPSTEEIHELHDSGISLLAFDLEIWDPKLFEEICPGKSKVVGREKWIAALKQAAEIHGQGKVAAGFVTGLEPKESFLEGAQYLAGNGVVPINFVWSPGPGSAYEGQRPPSAQWYLDLTTKLVDIWEDYGLGSYEESAAVWCHKCTNNTLYNDELRRRHSA